MVHTAFHASFLLAVPFLKDVPKQKKKKAAKEPKNKKKKSAKIVEEIPEVPVEETPLPYNGQMEVSKPTVFVHVEYTIIPEVLMYDLDVVCYGDVAKIYTRDHNVSVKTTVRGAVAWIPFTVDHSIQLSDELLECLHATTVTFNVWTDKKKQFKTTQQDKPRRFYMHEEYVDATFVPLDEWDVNGNKVPTEVVLPSLCVLVENSLRAIPYPDHRRIIEALVNQHSDNMQIVNTERKGKKTKKIAEDKQTEKKIAEDKQTDVSEEEDEEETAGGKKKKGKKDKKDKKGKKSPLAGSEELTILGEVFFANIREMKAEKTFETLSIPYMAVIFTVCDLFIGHQLDYFNPAVVQIRDVNNIPVKLFQKYGFEWIFMTYTLPNDKEYVTEKKRVDKVVSFNDTRVMLTRGLDATYVMEFILTKFLRIKLWGVRDERFCEPLVPNELFRFTVSNRCMQSRLLPDPYSHPYSKTDSEAVRFVQDKISRTVCLAEMEMDISALTTNQLLVESSNNFRRPRLQHEYGSTSGSWAYYNLPDVHDPGRVEPVNTSPFTDFMLQKTTVDVAFKLLAPLTGIMMSVYKSKEHYNRLIIVIDSTLEGQLCTDIIEEIYKTNLPFVSLLKPPNDLFYARKEFLRPHTGEWSEEITEELQGKQHFYQSRRGMFQTPIFGRSAVTGFILDNCDRVLIVLEGRNQSSLLKIYCFLEDLNVSSGLVVHYNSEITFKSRIYHDFLQMGGIMVITMDEPVEVKQMKKQFLLTRSTGGPSRAVQTINKLNNLFTVKDIATACRQDFFPSALHLVSFAMEFGIPFRLIDDYTENPTHLPGTMNNSNLNMECILSDLNLNNESSTQEVNKSASIGFDPTDLLVNMDMFGNSYNMNPGGFTLVHACSSTFSQSGFSSDNISIPNMAVSPVAAISKPTPEAAAVDNTASDDAGREEGPPVKDETSTDLDSKPATVHKQADTVPKKRSSHNIPRLSSKQAQQVARSVPPGVNELKKSSKGDTSGNLTLPKKSSKDSRLFENIPSLILPRRPIHTSYSYATPSNACAQTLDQRQAASDTDQTSKQTPPEPPCPIQEKYFRDFFSGTDVTQNKDAERKAKKAQKPPDTSPGNPKEFRVYKSVTIPKRPAKASVRKKRVAIPIKLGETSTEHFFPPGSSEYSEVGLDILNKPSNKSVEEQQKKRFRKTKKKPETPPEPPCPLQEYFKDYYESITSPSSSENI